MTAPDDNSGVFVAFPDPEQQNYDNTAYVGINFGFEIQIDELARPDNALIHRTGAIYSFKGPTDGPLIVNPVGEWNAYEITVDPPDFTVALNGQVVNQFHFFSLIKLNGGVQGRSHTGKGNAGNPCRNNILFPDDTVQ